MTLSFSQSEHGEERGVIHLAADKPFEVHGELEVLRFDQQSLVRQRTAGVAAQRSGLPVQIEDHLVAFLNLIRMRRLFERFRRIAVSGEVEQRSSGNQDSAHFCVVECGAAHLVAVSVLLRTGVIGGKSLEREFVVPDFLRFLGIRIRLSGSETEPGGAAYRFRERHFKSDTLEVKFHDKNIFDVLEMTVNQAIEFFNEHGQKKIVKKLLPLQDVGLGYIKLGQSSSTLSGGENQRVKLAFYLSQEKADPTLFIFDEPTTGLHFHDIRKLLDAFDALIRRGHSIVIIEHNMDVIKCADYVIDLGPEGGDKGGNIVAVGTPEEVAACGASYTGQFLKEKLK